jgi:hypothetical protein
MRYLNRRRMLSGLAGVAMIAASVLTFSSPAAAESSNLVGNPGFETDISGWGTQPGSGTVPLTRVTTDSHTGSASGQLQFPKDGTFYTLNDAPTNWITVPGGTDWVKMAAWVKGNSGQTIRFANGSGISYTVATLTNSSWTFVQAAFDVSTHPSAPWEFWLKFAESGGGTGTLLVDDLEATTGTDSAACVDPVSNCSFEYPYNLQQWNNAPDSGASSVALDTTVSHAGSNSAKVTRTSATTGTITLNDSPNFAKDGGVAVSSTSTCTATAWVKSDSASNGNVKISLQQVGGSNTQYVTSAAASTSWQQINVTANTGAGVTDVDWHVYQLSVPQNGILWVDDTTLSCT